MPDVADEPVVACEFDTLALGLPAFRIADAGADWALLVRTLPTPSFCDAKIAPDATSQRAALERAGFRHVVTQLTFEGAARACEDGNAEIAPSLDLSAEQLDDHAGNFALARHGADPLLPAAGSRLLMRRWIANSLGGRREVVHLGPDFMTFRADPDALAIDLLSVLRTRRGHGVRLVATGLAEAARRGLPVVRVTTEASNLPAVRTYLRCGLAPVSACLVMHRVA